MAKLLHTSDWHLGRTTYGVARADDHDAVLTELVELAVEFAPDAIVHTGDVFDVARPGYPDLQRGITWLQRLAEVAPVVVLCGNHDSPALFRLFATMLGPGSPIRFVDRARTPAEGGIIDLAARDGEERLRIAPVPFVHANRMLDAFEDAAQVGAAYTDRLRSVHQILDQGLQDGFRGDRDVSVVAADLHIDGAVLARSERQVHVGEGYATRVEHLPAVSYAAFGHIHKPQALAGTVTGRYAGSPIQLDFGEEGEEKVVVCVEAEPGRPARVEAVPITRGRALRRFSGSLDELAALGTDVHDAICVVTVQVTDPTPELAAQVRELFPHATVAQVSEEVASRRRTDEIVVLESGAADVGFTELFDEYVGDQGVRAGRADDVVALFRDLLSAIEAEQEVAVAMEAALFADLPLVVDPAVGSGSAAEVAP